VTRTTAAPALEMRGVEHAYGAKLALDGVSLELADDEILCLLGPSGCGKSTALRVVAGLERPRAGTVELAGRTVCGPAAFVPPERRDVGLLFQDFALFPHLDVAQNVAFGLRDVAAAERAARVDELLGRVGLSAMREAYPHMLSGGEQQRAALARALAPRPRVLLLDEPFSGLDAQLRQRVRDETLHVLKAMRAAVLLVTHDPEEALFMGDRVALMRQGRIRQAGAPADLYFRPREAYVAEFFGEVNRIATRVAGGSAATPFGALPAPGLAEGEPALVLIRSEALALRFAPDGATTAPHAAVMAARLLGRTNLVHLRTDPATGFDLHLHARMRGGDLPPPGTPVWIEIDRRLAFVFPEDGASPIAEAR
jgi:iron(III) transport system ATP-binding protein